MKKKAILPTIAFSLLMSVGSVSAVESGTPISDIPMDNGAVPVEIELRNDVQPDGTEATADANPEDNAAANDGTVLPLDPGNVEATDIDTGTVEATDIDTGTEVVTTDIDTAETDTVVLTEQEPTVEPLAQTGIADNSLLYAGLAMLLGGIGFVLTRALGRKETI